MEPKPKRLLLPGWFRRVGLVLLVLLAFGLAVVLSVRAYFVAAATERYRAVAAELDEQDPGWRWEEIEAQRAVIPPEENSALVVESAAKLLPKNWPVEPAAPRPQDSARPRIAPTEPDDSLRNRINRLAPNEPLDPGTVAELCSELEGLAPVLAKGRPIVTMPRARYVIAWKKAVLQTDMSHLLWVQRLAVVFRLEATRHAHDRDPSQALTSARGLLNVGRSIGDEAELLSLLMRQFCDRQTVRTVERVLGQGQVAPEALERFGQELEAEEAGLQPLLRQALRGNRAHCVAYLKDIAEGEVDVATIEDHTSQWYEHPGNWLLWRPQYYSNLAPALEYMTAGIDVISDPSVERRNKVTQLDAELQNSRKTSFWNAPALLLTPKHSKLVDGHDHARALLRSAIVALAVERYRHRNGTWPTNLEQLIPGYLGKLPVDPYTDEPLQFRQTQAGVIVYSVGPDGQDNQGAIADDRTPQGSDIGFRLYRSEERGKP